MILEHAHIGSQRSISILDLAQRVVEMTRSESGLRYVPYEEVYELGIEDMYHRVPATEKIAAAVGWRATLTSTAVLADVIKHLRTAGPGAEEEAQREEARSGASAASAARTASE